MFQALSANTDVLVAGGGPAGSTIAALLAARGLKVVLIEKEKHPRFHIGESLLPLNMPLFEELGVQDEIQKIGMMKYGVEFVSPYHNKAVKLEFANAWDKRFPYSYQVRRSEFDHILLKNAANKGAEIIEECRVTDVDFRDDGSAVVKARHDNGETTTWTTRFVVDATGRDTLLANRLELKERNRRHNSAAVFGHFSGARRLCGKEEGNITIFWFDHGWFWFIPLIDGTTSVGAVCPPDFIKARTGDVTSFFHEIIAQCPEIGDRLKDATLIGEATATGNYSYSASRMTGKNYIMIGDAFAFIDPVFSTGVFLAMRGGFLGADTVMTCLTQPKCAASALKRFDRDIRQGIGSFTWYIYRITRPAFRNLLMNPRNVLRMEEAVLGLLAGDVSRRSPIRPRLKIFKALYYVTNFLMKKFGWYLPESTAQAAE